MNKGHPKRVSLISFINPVIVLKIVPFVKELSFIYFFHLNLKVF